MLSSAAHFLSGAEHECRPHSANVSRRILSFLSKTDPLVSNFHSARSNDQSSGIESGPRVVFTRLRDEMPGLSRGSHICACPHCRFFRRARRAEQWDSIRGGTARRSEKFRPLILECESDSVLAQRQAQISNVVGRRREQAVHWEPQLSPNGMRVATVRSVIRGSRFGRYGL
jgi:hypothetical protein